MYCMKHACVIARNVCNVSNIFWSLRDHNHPNRSVSYTEFQVPINTTICSMLGLCGAHVGNMLRPCWLCVGQWWAHVEPWPMLSHVGQCYVGPMLRHVGRMLSPGLATYPI